MVEWVQLGACVRVQAELHYFQGLRIAAYTGTNCCPYFTHSGTSHTKASEETRLAEGEGEAGPRTVWSDPGQERCRGSAGAQQGHLTWLWGVRESQIEAWGQNHPRECSPLVCALQPKLLPSCLPVGHPSSAWEASSSPLPPALHPMPCCSLVEEVRAEMEKTVGFDPHRVLIWKPYCYLCSYHPLDSWFLSFLASSNLRK